MYHEPALIRSIAKKVFFRQIASFRLIPISTKRMTEGTFVYSKRIFHMNIKSSDHLKIKSVNFLRHYTIKYI